MTSKSRREAVVDANFLDDLRYWTETDRRLALRALRLMEEVLRDPFDGVGKPEPLRGQLGGKWSRRIDDEHHLVYQVDANRVNFLAARYHY